MAASTVHRPNIVLPNLPSDDRSRPVAKRKRSKPGHPDPNAEVVALSPKTLLTTNRYVCEICNKGFQRDQNLQLHKRGHNLPWNLKKRTTAAAVTDNEVARKKVYVCPESSCVHHNPDRALGDRTGIKKHYCRKHCEKKWKCTKCSRKYAVRSDWKAHCKTCGNREYTCSCGTIFSRKESYKTHRAYCDAPAVEKSSAATNNCSTTLPCSSSKSTSVHHQIQPRPLSVNPNSHPINPNPPSTNQINPPPLPIKQEIRTSQFSPTIAPQAGNPAASSSSSIFQYFPDTRDQTPNPRILLRPTALLSFCPVAPTQAGVSPFMSATGLLQQAAQSGAKSGPQFVAPVPAVGVLIRPQPVQIPAGDFNRILSTSFGLNFSSSDSIHGYGNGSKASAPADCSACGGATAGSSMDKMAASGGISNSPWKRADGTLQGKFSGADDDNVTRDFLGLKPVWK